jgi:hypothetical protein
VWAHAGGKVAEAVRAASWGRDSRGVQATGLCQSISVEDSFRACTSLAAADAVLRVLLPDLVARLVQERSINTSLALLQVYHRTKCAERLNLPFKLYAASCKKAPLITYIAY